MIADGVNTRHKPDSAALLASKRHELDPAALASAVSSGAVERYEKLGRIGEGTYGVVRPGWRARLVSVRCS